MFRIRILIAVLLASLTLASATEQVALLPLKSTGVSETDAATFTDVLRTEIVKSGRFTILERSQMDQILKEQGFQVSGACTDASCAVEMGQLLAVNYMALGSVGLVGKTYTLNVRLVDVGTGKIVKDVTQYNRGEIDELLTKILPQVATEICSYTKDVPAPVASQPAQSVASAQTTRTASAPAAETKPAEAPAAKVERKHHPAIPIVIISALVVGGGGAGAFFLFGNKKTTASAADNSSEVTFTW